MKQDTSSFYLLHTRHALIHPTGIILKQCGYIQPHEACETIFRFLGTKTINTEHILSMNAYTHLLMHPLSIHRYICF